MSTELNDPPLSIFDLWREEQLKRNQALIALIESWVAEDRQEDPERLRAEWEELKRALDESRPEGQKLFP